MQDETKRAVAAIAVTERSIEEGEALSGQSGEALEKIVAGAEQATAQVSSIARSTAEQANGSRMISQAIEQVSTMVNHIARSTAEQGEGSVQIMGAVERMKTLTEQVKNSTREQSTMGNFIARSTEHITTMIQQIQRACDEQSRGSDQIVPAVANIMEATDCNLGAVRMLNDSVASQKAQIDLLQLEIAKLNVSGSAPRT
ncbi:hypothetical protein LPW11_04345 [Geomonas sp. RF6]|nr:hypothetical protein [Geomonas sp. RF6]UFS71429.1 hypothetical protein LPW11_04345 [Geomonas sp. RF6]